LEYIMKITAGKRATFFARVRIRKAQVYLSFERSEKAKIPSWGREKSASADLLVTESWSDNRV